MTKHKISDTIFIDYTNRQILHEEDLELIDGEYRPKENVEYLTLPKVGKDYGRQNIRILDIIETKNNEEYLISAAGRLDNEENNKVVKLLQVPDLSFREETYPSGWIDTRDLMHSDKRYKLVGNLIILEKEWKYRITRDFLESSEVFHSTQREGEYY